MKPETRDRNEAAANAYDFLNLTRCVGGHVIASGFRCTHCESYEPSRICIKEKIDLDKEEKKVAKKTPKPEPKKDMFIEYTIKMLLPLKAIEGGDADFERMLDALREQGAAEIIGREILGEFTWDEASKEFNSRWMHKGLI
jgi:hypothetical protein